MNFKTASYEKAFAYIKEHLTNGEYIYKGITFKLDEKKKDGDNDSIRMHVDGIDFCWGGWYNTYNSDAKKQDAIYCMSSPHLHEIRKFTAAAELIADTFGVDLDSGDELALKEDTKVVDERDMTIAKLEAELSVYKRFAPTPDTVTFTKAGQ